MHAINFQTLVLADYFRTKWLKIPANASVLNIYTVLIPSGPLQEFNHYPLSNLSLALGHAAVKGERL
jgi:hypothetical protein